MSDLPVVTELFAVLTWVAGALLVLAGGAKLRWPGATVAALGDAGVPGGRGSVRVLGASEVATGAAVLLAGGSLAALAAAVLYAGFTVFVVRQRRTAGASCGCFGEARTPVSGLHLAVNVVATLAATGAAATGAGAPAVLVGGGAATIVGTLLLVAVGAWLVRLGLTAGADLQAAVALHPRTETAA